jgi:lactoylglutathione lyase
LAFGSGARLELMQIPVLVESQDDTRGPFIGYAHLAISVGSSERVDELTCRLRTDGHPVLEGPRRTGDGYYESSVLDSDGNRIEITV